MEAYRSPPLAVLGIVMTFGRVMPPLVADVALPFVPSASLTLTPRIQLHGRRSGRRVSHRGAPLCHDKAIALAPCGLVLAPPQIGHSWPCSLGRNSPASADSSSTRSPALAVMRPPNMGPSGPVRVRTLARSRRTSRCRQWWTTCATPDACTQRTETTQCGGGVDPGAAQVAHSLCIDLNRCAPCVDRSTAALRCQASIVSES
jgi:hypothetical protein